MDRITVIIPAIPPRARIHMQLAGEMVEAGVFVPDPDKQPTPAPRPMLTRALQSVCAQSRLPDFTLVRIDHDKLGAPGNRTALLDMVTTEFVAPLDDDDELYPHHLELLEYELKANDADLVYPWFDVGSGGTDPFPENFEFDQWDPKNPHQVPITMLARTDVLREHGGWALDVDDERDDSSTDALGNRAGEDYRLILRLNDAGLKIHHVPIRTWCWHHHASNTSGMASRW